MSFEEDDGGYINSFDLSTMKSAVEFGYKGCKRGYSLQKVLSDFDNFINKRWDE